MPMLVETMAYRNEDESSKPWHNVGFPIDHDADVVEMLKASGLDWTVSKRPLYAPLHLPEPGSNWDTDFLMDVPSLFALVRNSDRAVLGPAGAEYIPTQNHEAMDFFKKFAEAGSMRLETAGSLNGGRRIWVLAKVMDRSFVLDGGDKVEAYILLSSPHVWGMALRIKFTAIRVVCANTLAMALGDKSDPGFRLTHVRSFDEEVKREAMSTLGIATKYLEVFHQQAEKLAAVPASDEVVVRYIADIYQRDLLHKVLGPSYAKMPRLEQAAALMDPGTARVSTVDLARNAGEVYNLVKGSPGADLPSSRGTMWGALNAVTYHIDHLTGSARQDLRLESAWFGAYAKKKAEALDLALQMSDAYAR